MPRGSLLHPGMAADLGTFAKRTVTFQQNTPTRDAAGQPIPAWADVPGLVDLACRFAPAQFSKFKGEIRRPDSTVAINPHVIVIVAGYAIDLKYRAVLGGNSYDVLHVERDSEELVMYVLVEQVVT